MAYGHCPEENQVSKVSGSFFQPSPAGSFSPTYISPNVLALPGNVDANVPAKMSDIFVSTLSDLATDLEDNCESPAIKITASGASEVSPGLFHLYGNVGANTKIPISVEDLNDSAGNTTFEISYREYRYDINQPPFNIETPVKVVANSAAIPIPFASIMYYVSIYAHNTITNKSTYSTARFIAPNDIMPTVTTMANCLSRMVDVGIKDVDSGTIRLGVWYPDQFTGIYEGSFIDNATVSPFGYFYSFDNIFFNEMDVLISFDFVNRDSVRVIYQNSDGKVGYVEVANSCKY